MAKKPNKTNKRILQAFAPTIKGLKREVKSDLNKRSLGRHAITHAVVKNRFKRLGPISIFLGIGWLFLILAIINKGFLYLSGTSILADLFNFIFESVFFRLLFFTFSIWAIIDLAKALGQSSVVQPFERFTKHLQSVNASGGDKFVLRGKDILFVPIVVAFNQMINRLRHEDEKRKNAYRQFLHIIESKSNSLTKEETQWLQQIKRDLE